MTSLGRAATRGAGVTLAAQGIRLLMQVGSLVILARLLTPEQFGLVAMVTAITGIAEIFRDFGLSSASIQAKEISDGERTNLFWVNVLIGTICAAVAAACSGLIGDIYGQPGVPAIVLALSWLFVVSGANTQFRAELSRSLRFSALAGTEMAAQALSIVTAITAAAIGSGYWAIVYQQVVFVLCTCAFNVFQCRWRPGLPRRGVSLRRFFRFGAGLLGMQLLGYTTNNVDNVAIGAAWGPNQVGLYGRAYQLLIVPLNQVSSALTRVALPVLSRVQDDEPRFLRFLRQAQLLCCYGFGLAYAVAAGLSVPLVAILFGDGWDAVAPIFAMLAIGGIFRGLAQVTYWITLAKGLTGSQLRFYLLARPFMIVSILAGLPWGAVGVAVGHSAAFALEWLASLWWVGRAAHIDVKPLARKALRSVLVVCLPAGLFAYLGTRLVSNVALELVCGLGLATLALILLCLLSSTERADVRSILDILRRGIRREAERR